MDLIHWIQLNWAPYNHSAKIHFIYEVKICIEMDGGTVFIRQYFPKFP